MQFHKKLIWAFLTHRCDREKGSVIVAVSDAYDRSAGVC